MFRSKFLVKLAHNNQIALKRFAGHSKWKNIMHTKQLKDGQKAGIFSKYSRQIRMAIQEGGGNPALNSSLRNIIDEALKKNMPMATINNQIKKCTGSNQAALKKHYIEIKALNNKIFMICEFYTENLQLVKSPVNTLLRKTKQSSTVADISHMFEELGIILASKPDEAFTNAEDFEEKMTEVAIEVDAQELEDIDYPTKTATFSCRPIDIEKVKKSLLNFGFTIENSEHIFVPNTTCQLSDLDQAAYETLKQKLSQIEGFENIYDNVEINDT